MAASRLGLAYQKLSLQLITHSLGVPQLLLHILPLNDLLIASRVINRCKVRKRILPLLAVFLRFMLELLKDEASNPLLISLKLRIAESHTVAVK